MKVALRDSAQPAQRPELVLLAKTSLFLGAHQASKNSITACRRGKQPMEEATPDDSVQLVLQSEPVPSTSSSFLVPGACQATKSAIINDCRGTQQQKDSAQSNLRPELVPPARSPQAPGTSEKHQQINKFPLSDSHTKRCAMSAGPLSQPTHGNAFLSSEDANGLAQPPGRSQHSPSPGSVQEHQHQTGDTGHELEDRIDSPQFVEEPEDHTNSTEKSRPQNFQIDSPIQLRPESRKSETEADPLTASPNNMGREHRSFVPPHRRRFNSRQIIISKSDKEEEACPNGQENHSVVPLEAPPPNNPNSNIPTSSNVTFPTASHIADCRDVIPLGGKNPNIAFTSLTARDEIVVTVKNDRQKWAKDPLKLKVKQLKEVLNKFKVKYKSNELKPALINRNKVLESKQCAIEAYQPPIPTSSQPPISLACQPPPVISTGPTCNVYLVDGHPLDQLKRLDKADVEMGDHLFNNSESTESAGILLLCQPTLKSVSQETPHPIARWQPGFQAYLDFALDSKELVKSTLQAVGVIAKGVTVIKETVRLSPGIFSNTQSGALTSQRSPHDRAADDLYDLESPTAKLHYIPGAGPVADEVRRHVIRLFGRAASNGDYPPPASDEDRRSWVQPIEDPGNEDFDDSDSDKDPLHMDEDFDPCFPYPDGPGHPRATPESLKIIWRMVRRAGVWSFRPDLGKSVNSVSNCFLWELAARTFMRRVDSGRFNLVTRDICDLQMVQQIINRFVYYDNNKFEEAELKRHARARQAVTLLKKLIEWQIAEIQANPELAGLIRIVQGCTSNNKSDEEAVEDLEVEDDLGPARRPKRCVALHVPWCSPWIGHILNWLNQLHRERLEAAETRLNAPPTCQQRQDPNPRVGRIKPVFRLPRGACNPDWLRTLLPRELVQMDAVETPVNHYLTLMQAS
ncbi:hypothetical protein PtB15_18B356 [Puccinia triticina]|nr:hypothetical protein PtB15_18B356 [Puccinia triticina]